MDVNKLLSEAVDANEAEHRFAVLLETIGEIEAACGRWRNAVNAWRRDAGTPRHHWPDSKNEVLVACASSEALRYALLGSALTQESHAEARRGVAS